MQATSTSLISSKRNKIEMNMKRVSRLAPRCHAPASLFNDSDGSADNFHNSARRAVSFIKLTANNMKNNQN